MALVEAGIPGKRVIVHQRSVESPPYTNCRLVDGTRQLIFGGVSVPDRRRLIRVWRDATGVPEVGPDGPQGTTAADLMRGAATVLPWVPFRYGPWSDDDLLAAIAGGRLTFTAGVLYPALPDHLRRWSPSFTGKHAAGVVDVREVGAARRQEVWWVDGLRTDSAEGEWVPWSTIRRAIEAAGMTTASGVWGMTLEKGAAMSTTIIVDRTFPTPAAVSIPSGTKRWKHSPRTLRLEPLKATTRAHEALTYALVDVRSKPDIPGVPDARMLRIETGSMVGQYVKVRDVKVKESPAPGDCQPLIDAAVNAATAPLIERLAAWETARTLHDAVDFPDPVL